MRFVDAPIWVKTARFIKWARVGSNCTQEELALKAGIELKLLKRIERGLIRDVTIEQAYKIAYALDCSMSEIIPLVR